MALERGLQRRIDRMQVAQHGAIGRPVHPAAQQRVHEGAALDLRVQVAGFGSEGFGQQQAGRQATLRRSNNTVTPFRAHHRERYRAVAAFRGLATSRAFRYFITASSTRRAPRPRRPGWPRPSAALVHHDAVLGDAGRLERVAHHASARCLASSSLVAWSPVAEWKPDSVTLAAASSVQRRNHRGQHLAPLPRPSASRPRTAPPRRSVPTLPPALPWQARPRSSPPRALR